MRDAASATVAILLQSVGPMLVAKLALVGAISLLLAGCVEAAGDPDPIDEPGDDETTTAVPDRIAGCTPSTLPPDARLTGVWIAPGGAVWAVGDGALVGRRAADAWQWCTTDGGTNLSAIWGAADDDIWITGDAGTLLRWRGAAFDRTDLGTTADLTAVWGAAANNVFVVGDAGVVRHHDGTAWRSADVAADELGAVWGANATDVWIGGKHRTTVTLPSGSELNQCESVLHRWNPATHTFVLEQSFTQDHGACGIHGIGGQSATDVWAVGTEFPAGAAASFAFAAHRDGAQWSRAAPPDEELTIDRTYMDVAAGAPGAEDGVWVVTTGISAVRRSGGSWSQADTTTADLLDIDTRGSLMFAVGDRAKILRWTGSAWLQEP